MIARAKNEGIKKCFLPAIDKNEWSRLISVEQKFPQFLFAMVGVHPCSIKENYKEELDFVAEQLSKRTFAGIGETGLDFYWDKTFIREQEESLRVHAEWAIQYNRPIILHTRNSTKETIDIIREYVPRGIRGIFHCFSGNIAEANEIIDMGFYLGIGGVVTFKNSSLQEIVKKIDLNHLVLETDSPYLAPAPYRGKRNESSYLKLVAEKIAEIKNCTIEEVADKTTSNAKNIFYPY